MGKTMGFYYLCDYNIYRNMKRIQEIDEYIFEVLVPKYADFDAAHKEDHALTVIGQAMKLMDGDTYTISFNNKSTGEFDSENFILAITGYPGYSDWLDEMHERVNKIQNMLINLNDDLRIYLQSLTIVE